MSHVDLREWIEEIDDLEGAGTELVTVAIPLGTSIDSIRTRIAQEHANAENFDGSCGKLYYLSQTCYPHSLTEG